ncbi:MAG TPA: homocysteine S-methyltransferase family protein [Nitrososphaera sp.]
MPKYRNHLPQLSGEPFLTDGGIETTLIYREGFELPHFAAFHLLQDDLGIEALRRYYRTYASIAAANKVGFILESPTWRANRDWGIKLGYDREGLANANRRAIDLLIGIREEYENENSRMVISGCIGPRGDGYNPSNMMSVAEAEQYHSEQIKTFAETEADMVSAITMNYPQEAEGIIRAAKREGMPVAISFTVETNGLLPTGQSLESVITALDEVTDSAPVYYMINCAHPTHIEKMLDSGDKSWSDRIRGLRANASSKSHAELDQATELDDGDPVELGRQYGQLVDRLKCLNVLGGCCGTDHRHVQEIAKVCIPQ